MTGDLWDAIDWQHLVGKAGAKAGYLDGVLSMWPPEAWQAFQTDPVLVITVLADEHGQAFDVERGNASALQVVASQEGRLAQGLWSVTYSGMNSWADVMAAMKAHGLAFTDRQYWPKAGIYIWPTDPSGNLASGVWRLPVDPIAVQDGFYGAYDHSTTWQGFPGQPLTPNPQPETGEVKMFLAVAAGPEVAGIKQGDQFIVFGNAYRYSITEISDSEALQAKLGPLVPVSAGWLANLPNMP